MQILKVGQKIQQTLETEEIKAVKRRIKWL